MPNDKQGPMENLLQGLDEQSDALSSAQLKADLQARGIDIEPFLQQMEEMIAAHDKQQRLAWMQVADEKKESFATGESRWLDRSREEIIAAFADFLNLVGEKRALAFRNRGDLSVEDMVAILEANERLQRGDQGEDGPKT